MKNSKLSGLLLSLMFCCPIQGQERTSATRQPGEEEVVVISTNLVQVDVVITDKEGRHVTDLQPEDFEVYENKKKQQITNFSYIATDGRTANLSGGRTDAQPVGLPSSQTRRTLAIVVDDLGISFESLPFVRDALSKFVDEQMRPDDQVAIFLTSKSISSLQQFTSDKNRLRAAIESIRFYPGGHGGLSAFEQPSMQMKDATENSALVNKSASIIADVEAARAANYTVGTFGTLDFIMQGLSELPGRKAMMLYAESFRLFTNRGRNVQLLEYLKRLTDRANRASTVIYTTDASGLNQLNATAADKVLGLSYTFDPKILLSGPGGASPEDRKNNQSTVAPSLSQVSRNEGGSSAAFKNLEELMSLRDTQNIESQSVLSLLAQETGGLFTRNTNNLAVGTQQMLEDQKGYYLIGYRPDAPMADEKTGPRRYHNLTVKVKRAGLRVRSREGYYGLTTAEARKARRTREEQLAAAITSPFSAGGVDVRMTPLFFNDRDAGYYIRALLHLDPQALTFTDEVDGTRQTVFDILAVNFGEGGKVVDQYNDTQTIKVPAAAYERMLHDGLSFVLNIPVKQPGAYQLRMAVRDAASDRVGTAGQYIEVPDLNKSVMTLSGIVLSGMEARSIKNVSTTATADAPSTGEEPGMQFSPALRRVRQGMTLKYDYVIYNAQPDAATGRPRVETQMRLFREGKQVYAGTLISFDAGKAADPRRINASGRIRIGPDLTPGTYVLQVAVKGGGATDKSRPVTATQSTDFEVIN
jgi:VWFA-related protein